MPFKSKAQRAYLYANNPGVAAKFEAHTPKGVKPKKKNEGYNVESAKKIAASVGRKKHGIKKMASMAAKGSKK